MPSENHHPNLSAADESALYQSLVENFPACIIRKHCDGRIAFVNAAFAALLGKKPDEIIGKTDDDLYPPAVAQRYRDEDLRVMESGEPLDDVEENTLLGMTVYYASRKGPVRDANGQIVGVQTVFWDITVQRCKDKALLDERDMLHSIMEKLPDFVYVKDREGRYVVVNEAVRRVLKAATISEVIGKSNEDFLPADQAALERADDEKVISSGVPLTNREECMVNEDGEETWLLTSKLPLFDNQGDVIGLVGIDRNITSLKQAADALREAKDAADAANQAKSDFLANMSHEIRTPMNAIIGMTDLLLETHLSKTQREYLGMVQTSGEALLTLINDILDFSKIESGKFELDSTTFDIRETLGDTMKAMGLRAHDKGLELACRIDDLVPNNLVGDPGRIRQVVVNLVGNAIKFTEAGEVVLTIDCDQASENEATVAVCVSDTGIGISAEHCQRVFEEFEQADASTTRKFGGTGLGLAISARLVQLMNGHIWVESELGKGSKFRFEITLPVDPSQRAAAVRTHVKNVDGVRALVVDDNATNRRILKDMLTNWGMEPTTTSGAAAALQAMTDARDENDAFRVVISDVNMPEMDGLGFAEQVLRGKLLDARGIIMLTSGARPEHAEQFRELEIRHHLLKPAKQSELFDAIIAALDGGKTEYMPRMLDGQMQASEDRATATPPPSVSDVSRELNILLAEDNHVNQKLALGILGSLGHHVTIANNGKEALEKLEQREFDLILMDVQMPEMDGLTATRMIRRREAQTKTYVPVVAMTAHAMKGDREYCLAAGMDDYLCKPIRLRDMQDKLAELFPATSDDLAELASSLPTDDVIDWPTALRNVNNDAALLRDVANEFLEDTPDLLAKAVDAANEGDAEALRSCAHSIKGSLLFLGPKDALKSAQDVESHATDGNLESATKSLDSLHDHFGSVCQSIESYLARCR